MRVTRLALALTLAALIAPAAAQAQSTAQQMLDMAQKIRASAEQLKDSLPAEDRAKMIEQAEEIEKAVREGAYAGMAAPKKEPTTSERILAAHGGRLDWLAKEAACAGYTQENFETFRYSPAINDRDDHCRNAYAHWARYLTVTRNGLGEEESEKALYYYDAAAQRAVDLVGRR